MLLIEGLRRITHLGVIGKSIIADRGLRRTDKESRIISRLLERLVIVQRLRILILLKSRLRRVGEMRQTWTVGLSGCVLIESVLRNWLCLLGEARTQG